jgi:hypothetical protein
MNDTPKNIKELQLKIWLSKSPGERLRQFLEDNASLFQFWAAARKSNLSQGNKGIEKGSQGKIS